MYQRSKKQKNAMSKDCPGGRQEVGDHVAIQKGNIVGTGGKEAFWRPIAVKGEQKTAAEETREKDEKKRVYRRGGRGKDSRTSCGTVKKLRRKFGKSHGTGKEGPEPASKPTQKNTKSDWYSAGKSGHRSEDQAGGANTLNTLNRNKKP